MPKNGANTFQFPLQAVSTRKREAAGMERVDERWDEEAVPVEYGVESPTIPPPVAFAPMVRGSMNSDSTTGARGTRNEMDDDEAVEG
ncbi:hypothetical protein G647_05861 [Cladophialophora carrionii CBS 160.54]|uniref:Uncharacterized protein n=1 Tax=Cladophialophora carrionii CBS 160.54 TaxID=1279043 RepID=V9D730_9EURO|nr:uncharacterized protein G647_05861 [Cladophialophora carrionii CBS 160.54]ETI21792.1 hypothetical protein G647_05861 [Cladophialophora carrionii CBS 160.54]